MFSLKKLMIATCGLILTFSATMMCASAYDIDLSTGSTFDASAGLTSLRLNISGLASSSTATENYTTDGTVFIKAPKGVFSSEVGYFEASSLDANGLIYKTLTGTKSPAFSVGVDALNPEYDVLKISWSDSKGCYTTTGAIVEALFVYANGTPSDVELTILSDSKITISDKNGSYSPEDVDQPFAENTTTYILTSTGEITKKSAATATVLGDHTGDKETEGDEADTTDKAVAILGTPAAPESQATSLVWTVTPNTGDAQQFTQAVDVEGGATYKFGLVLRNITEDLIKTVSAVLQ